MTGLEQRRFFVWGLAEQEEGGEGFGNLLDHVVHEVAVFGDIGEFGFFVKQAAAAAAR